MFTVIALRILSLAAPSPYAGMHPAVARDTMLCAASRMPGVPFIAYADVGNGEVADIACEDYVDAYGAPIPDAGLAERWPEVAPQGASGMLRVDDDADASEECAQY